MVPSIDCVATVNFFANTIAAAESAQTSSAGQNSHEDCFHPSYSGCLRHMHHKIANYSESSLVHSSQSPPRTKLSN